MSAGGKYISGSHTGGGSSFLASNVVKQKQLYPGTYYILIDPTFNEQAELDEDYKQVVVDVYSTQFVSLIPVSEEEGMSVFKQSLKDYAQNKSDESKRNNFCSAVGFDQSYRLIQMSIPKTFYGFLYDRNHEDAPDSLISKVWVEPTGFEIVGRDDIDPTEFNIKPGQDDLQVWRWTGWGGSYSLSHSNLN